MTKDEIIDGVADLLTMYGDPVSTHMNISQDPYRKDLFKLFLVAATGGYIANHGSSCLRADALIEELLDRGIPVKTENLKSIRSDWNAWTYYYEQGATQFNAC